ncbi:DNA-binding transcriptional LysR family regulator [Motilibacter peucedani]|uniref:DNA-binding transcriptional LysR family regulator n=1 Tax=Motilibacter peucedani TaxID=598650 RepID=A0A420XT78_9ACTN|nr:LysR substrate-binding domain-containing protein [Motilibacter peucedani]RKS80036.1 DNA-binding transcriptional LysR family regulator [Motilibacter peucedani]
MDVELRHLRYFVAVAEELHFGRAAQRLHMAQPPLSQAIRQLEEIVGHQLLTRSSRSVGLTPAGEAFLDRARRTLRNVARDVDEARSIGRGEAGVLNVGYVGSVMLTLLPHVLRAHLERYPGVQLRLHESYTSRVVEGLLDGSVDVGVVRDSEPVAGLVAAPLLVEPFVAVVPAAHPAAAGDETSALALRGDVFVSPIRGAGTRAYEKPLSICEEQGFRPTVAHEATHWLTIVRLVGAGLGVTIAPECVRVLATPEVRCLSLPEARVRSEVSLVHRVGETRSMVATFEALATATARGQG